jgi:hypothetical protein
MGQQLKFKAVGGHWLLIQHFAAQVAGPPGWPAVTGRRRPPHPLLGPQTAAALLTRYQLLLAVPASRREVPHLGRGLLTPFWPASRCGGRQTTAEVNDAATAGRQRVRNGSGTIAVARHSGRISTGQPALHRHLIPSTRCGAPGDNYTRPRTASSGKGRVQTRC